MIIKTPVGLGLIYGAQHWNNCSYVENAWDKHPETKDGVELTS